mgnify:CR=1 FL=1
MPVEDHEIHPMTRVGSDFRYGCHDKPRRRLKYQVKNGFKLIHAGAGNYESVQMWKTIEDVGSIDCHTDKHDFALGKPDPACEGCKHYQGMK